ncbi:uncharacterized protein LOC111357800 [Spodoptera litura]|uniref:Uncharacterized protein LOC111357800 n=1 Tax=Spodoptera litura TaxID=69820 RepID=A0A9J7IXA0_SPOLT|nr:uncharacterized protein LOC111357800 [Spodoptera litura]
MYGTPSVIVCDNGKQFVSNQFKDLVSEYGVKLWYTPYYHPQANPTERVNKVIGSAIASYVEDNHKEWDKYIPHIGHAIRTSVHEVTGKTPAYLFFGRETIIRAMKPYNFEPGQPITFDKERFERNMAFRNKIYEEVSERMRQSHETNSDQYNKRRRTCRYDEGDLVWKRTKLLSNADKSFMSKLAPKFEKAVVAEKISDDVYRLKSFKGKDLGKWHSCDLKRLV